jgi:AraC-like DNA-binding protein
VPYSISRGDVYVMGVGSEHTFGECDELFLHSIHFSSEIFRDLTWDELVEVPLFYMLVVDRIANRRLHLDPTAYAEVARDLAELWSEWRNGTRVSVLLVRTLFLRLLLRLTRFAAGENPPPLRRPTQTRHREDVISDAVRTIDLHYGQRLRIDELAARAYLSPDRFTKLFSSVMGRTPRDYIRYVRLEHAKTLLTTTSIPISEIARTTGLGDHPSFTYAFRVATGVSPREFRKLAQS